MRYPLTYQYTWQLAIRVAFFFSFPEISYIIDSYGVGGRSRQDLGLGSWTADLSQARSYHQTDLWVDAGATWVGNLSVEAINRSQKYQGSFWVCRVSFQKEPLIKRGIGPEKLVRSNLDPGAVHT